MLPDVIEYALVWCRKQCRKQTIRAFAREQGVKKFIAVPGIMRNFALLQIPWTWHFSIWGMKRLSFLADTSAGHADKPELPEN